MCDVPAMTHRSLSLAQTSPTPVDQRLMFSRQARERQETVDNRQAREPPEAHPDQPRKAAEFKAGQRRIRPEGRGRVWRTDLAGSDRP
jgi:hypothetical protein